MLPANGVYGGRCEVAGRRFAVAVSLGPNPTFGDERQKVECHVVGFSGDLYGELLSVDLLTEIRPLRSFASVDELRQQITADIEAVIRRVAPAG
jgi:riboflavin kinase/FMN adenylyltransferase